jgi:hypothetical protein
MKITHRNTWKAMERKIAKMFNTKRTPLSGMNSGHTHSDSLHKHLFLECKLKAKIPFYSTFKQTKENALKEKKIPVVIFHEKNSKNNIMMTDLKDFFKINKILDSENIKPVE